MGHAGLHELDHVVFWPHTSHSNVCVGPGDEKHVTQVNKHGHGEEDDGGSGVGVGARQLDDEPVDAEDFLNLWAAQLQRRGECDVGQAAGVGGEPGEQHQQAEAPGGHEGAVVQRAADGQVAVVGHEHQEGHLVRAEGEDRPEHPPLPPTTPPKGNTQ